MNHRLFLLANFLLISCRHDVTTSPAEAWNALLPGTSAHAFSAPLAMRAPSVQERQQLFDHISRLTPSKIEPAQSRAAFPLSDTVVGPFGYSFEDLGRKEQDNCPTIEMVRYDPEDPHPVRTTTRFPDSKSPDCPWSFGYNHVVENYDGQYPFMFALMNDTHLLAYDGLHQSVRWSTRLPPGFRSLRSGSSVIVQSPDTTYRQDLDPTLRLMSLDIVDGHLQWFRFLVRGSIALSDNPFWNSDDAPRAATADNGVFPSIGVVLVRHLSSPVFEGISASTGVTLWTTSAKEETFKDLYHCHEMLRTEHTLTYRCPRDYLTIDIQTGHVSRHSSPELPVDRCVWVLEVGESTIWCLSNDPPWTDRQVMGLEDMEVPRERSLRALDRVTGTLRWEHHYVRTARMYPSFVAIFTQTRTVQILDKDTGRSLWTYPSEAQLARVEQTQTGQVIACSPDQCFRSAKEPLPIIPRRHHGRITLWSPTGEVLPCVRVCTLDQCTFTDSHGFYDLTEPFQGESGMWTVFDADYISQMTLHVLDTPRLTPVSPDSDDMFVEFHVPNN